jgi:hypothetical protein
VLLAAVAAMVIVVPFLPESETLQKRVSTLSTLHTDASLQGRLRIAQLGSMAVLQRPLGFGMGSSGNGGRLVEGGTDGIGDNGYLSLLADLGVPGFLFFATGVGLIISPLCKLNRIGATPVATTLGLSMLGSSLIFLLIFNTFTSAHASYMWIAISSGFTFLEAHRSTSVSTANRAPIG